MKTFHNNRRAGLLKIFSSIYLMAFFLTAINFFLIQNNVFAAGKGDNCEKNPPPIKKDAKKSDPTFVQLSRKSAIRNEKLALELPRDSSTQVIVSYEKSIITTTPEIQIASSLPDWLTVTGNTNAVDLGDEEMGFVEMTFTVGLEAAPDSTAGVVVNLIDCGPREIKASGILKVTADRTLFAEISVPARDSLVRADVPIFGLAYGENFSSYTVEYGAGYEPSVWTPIITSNIPQTNDNSSAELIFGNDTIYGNLATWETGLTEYVYKGSPVDLNGIYTVRLRVSNMEGKTVTDEVSVQVGRVMGSIYAATAVSPDGDVLLSLQEQSIKEDFVVIGIEPVDSGKAPLDPGYRLIGKIYELQPPGLEFSKDATLQFSYTDSDLGAGDETKLGIYTYNPDTSRWNYVSSEIDAVDNTVSAVIRSIAPEYAYYAIFEKISFPNKPVLNQPASPTQSKLAIVCGVSDGETGIEVFVNGVLRAAGAASDTGAFSVLNVILDDGVNTITARAKDRYNQVSPYSEPVTIEVVEPQITVGSLKFMTSDYSLDYDGAVDIGDSLYLELSADDPNPEICDKTSVFLTSSSTDPAGIEIQLTETGSSTGIYRAGAKIGLTSSRPASTIAAYQDGEAISAKSKIDGTKTDSVNFYDDTAPLPPAITSSTHPSVCQDTFEEGFDQWSNRDGDVGAALSLNSAESADGFNCLELLNQEYGGNFASNIRTTQFDAKEYPLVSFDYKINENVKINLLVKTDEQWYEILFTDDPKQQYWALNMKKIGQVQGVTADNNWHSASFNLYEMLKAQGGSTIVKEMIMADWDEDGFMKLVYGTNAGGVKYYIDNFKITKYGCSNANPQFNVVPPAGPSGIAGYSYILDELPDTIPDTQVDAAENLINYSGISDGTWYLHIKAKDTAGNWSAPNRYKITIDTHSPVADSPVPADVSSSGNPVITARLSDAGGTGVNPESIILKVNGVEYGVSSPALSYNAETEMLTFTPSEAGIIWPDSYVVNACLKEAKDYAGNSLAYSLTWEWTLSYSLDTAAPVISNIYSYRTRSLNSDLVTVCWNVADPNGVADYSFILDQSPETIPDTTGEGLAASKSYPDLTTGEWYFHLRAKDRPGNWSQTTHYKVDFSKNSISVDDFDDGIEPNDVGEVSGVWTTENGFMTDNYVNDPAVRYSDSGYSKRLNYDVTAASSQADWWTKFPESSDMSGYTHLSLQLKAETAGGNFKIGLKDRYGNEHKVSISEYLAGGLTTEYTRISIPLSDFAGIDLSNLESMNISFDNAGAVPSTGVIYVDEIRFVNSAGWNTVVIDLASTDWKSEATGWEYNGAISDLNNVKHLSIGVFGYCSEGSVYIDNIRLADSLVDMTTWDTAENLRNWSVADSYSDGISLTLSNEIFSEGNHSFRLDYAIKGYDKAFLHKDLASEDWSSKRYLIFDLYNPGDIKLVTAAVLTGDFFVWHEALTRSFSARPETPIVNLLPDLTNEGQILISGKADSGVEIIPFVKTASGAIFEQTHVFADANGDFSSVIYLEGDGQKTVYCYAKDSTAAKSLSSSAEQVVILDKTPPAVPTVGSIETPRREPQITVAGLAESASSVYIKVSQPLSADAEYTVKAAAGIYSKDIVLNDGDGVYRISVWSSDPAGNSSAEYGPVEVVLDAVNEPPSMQLTLPIGKELIEGGSCDIHWQAGDPDPTDTIAIGLKYTDSADNQILVDNFDDRNDTNSLGQDSGFWSNNGGQINLFYTDEPVISYGLAESLGKWAAAYWYSDAYKVELSSDYVKQGRYSIKKTSAQPPENMVKYP
ncbi:MAG: hypothetical protein V1933_03390 [Candidatus Omnitrophota bacterium]